VATLGISEADRVSIEAFKADVIEPSMTSLVILDFWAEWCGPCKQLTPLLEKVATLYANKGVVLAKINVDENKAIAAQFRVQSIPAVFAMFQGQPVADLTSARTEGQLTKMLDQILKQLPVKGEAQSLEAEIEPLIVMGEDVLATGDAERAASIFTQIVEMAPQHPAALSGLIRALVTLGASEEAQAVVDSLTPELLKDAAIGRALSALSLAREAKPVADLTGLQAQVAAEPKNHTLRFELAGGLMAAGDYDGAADALLDIIAADREWNESAARTQLLKLFDVVGIADPWVYAQRRRLSAVLFT
jgi:putative thioredoxin